MKKILLLAATVFTLAAFQSCSKCGHCTYTTATTFGGTTNTNTNEGQTYCGDNGNESGAWYKAEKIDCERWAAEQPVVTGVTYTSTWTSDK